MAPRQKPNEQPIRTRYTRHGEKGTAPLQEDWTGRESVAGDGPDVSQAPPAMLAALERTKATVDAAIAASGETDEERGRRIAADQAEVDRKTQEKFRQQYLGEPEKPIEHRSAPPLGASGCPEREITGAELKRNDNPREETLADARPVRRTNPCRNATGQFSSRRKNATEKAKKAAATAALRDELRHQKLVKLGDWCLDHGAKFMLIGAGIFWCFVMLAISICVFGQIINHAWTPAGDLVAWCGDEINAAFWAVRDFVVLL